MGELTEKIESINRDKALTFEEFSASIDDFGSKRYLNFFQYFNAVDKDSIINAFFKQPHFIKFKERHLDLYDEVSVLVQGKTECKETFSEIRSNISQLIDFDLPIWLEKEKGKLQTIERKLYEAYLVMREYVESDSVILV